MPEQNSTPVTQQRAYTLRLCGSDSTDSSWRDALWQTHEAVNRGAKAFGDWMLTLRGGLDHALAEGKVSGGKGKPDRIPTPEERKARRILLALSWLSVESELGAPRKFIVASGQDSEQVRNDRVIAALREILASRGLAEEQIDGWSDDCSASLSAAIRDDAVWVNRSKAFDEAVDRIGPTLTREEAWDMLERFFGSREAYLAPIEGIEDEPDGTDREEQAKDLVQKAGQWLSSRFGTGEGANFGRMAEVYGRIAVWAKGAPAGATGETAVANLADALREFDPASRDLKGALGLVSASGHKSATRNLLRKIDGKVVVSREDLDELSEKATEDREKCAAKTGSKGRRPYSDAILRDVEFVCGFSYRADQSGRSVSVNDYSKYSSDYKWGSARHSEFSVMLDHAARRVSLAHTWIKRAEAERRKFEGNAKKMQQVPPEAREFLERYCNDRSATSGAVEAYRIRRRATDAWGDVVNAWAQSSCVSAADRVAAARALQDNPEIDKFGDIRLFEALAEDEAACVWRGGGDAASPINPQPLIDYVLASEAEFKKRQFKVPMYRHPDALLHPVFCDFGESRWDIRYGVHQRKKRNKKNETEQTSNARDMSLTLWTGFEMKSVPMRWQSKRLARDLALDGDARNEGKPEAVDLSRADRLGRAASGAAKGVPVNIAGLFEQDKWNGRLQAPRQQLRDIAAARDDNRCDDAERERRMALMIRRIRWTTTFSAQLQQRGPWRGFAEKLGLSPNTKHWPHSEANKSRKGQARLVLSRLPGLRALSVDLGHRHAAACAVWEAVAAEQVSEACRLAGRGDPTESDLFLHLKIAGPTTKRKDDVRADAERTVLYRRIGADKLPDGTPHPAPWARLDRQFLIMLQGEKDIREASNEEIWAAHCLEVEVGKNPPLIDRLARAGWGRDGKQKARLDALRELGWRPREAQGPEETDEDESRKPSLSVDDLMSYAVRVARLALRRHGDRARIAHCLVTNEKTMPGGVRIGLDERGRAELLLDALDIWRGLFSSPGWRDEHAKHLWDAHIKKLPGYEEPEPLGGNESGEERRKKRKANREILRAAAEALAENEKLRADLHEAWKRQWEDDDGRWKMRLRQVKDWILPRNKRSGPAIRKVGGLSLDRLATLTEFRRQVQVAFFTRLRPDGSKAETKERFGQKSLDALERLREQRVKQLASRIVEAALGVGRTEPRKGRGSQKRPEVCVDKPCHVVVIEDLTRYRPEETRTRRENRQLMTWSSSKVKKYLDDACLLHGLHLREVPASYTSRQDSRTGAPGVRCRDVPVNDFMQSPYWRKQVEQAKSKLAEGKGDSLERYLCELDEQWRDKKEKWDSAGAIRIPAKGGEIFVSADPCGANGLQADLNAAANIGLRALIDPDWPGKWWYVPCDPASFKPVGQKTKGSAAIDPNAPLKDGVDGSRKKEGRKAKAQSKEVVNLWRDVSSKPISANAGESDDASWRVHSDYWNRAQVRAINNLRQSERKKNDREQQRP